MNEQERHRPIRLVVQKDDGNPDHFTYQRAIELATEAQMDVLVLDPNGAWLAQREGSLYLLCINAEFVPIPSKYFVER